MLDRRQLLATTLGAPALALVPAVSAIVSGDNAASWRAVGDAVVRSTGPHEAARLLATERAHVAAINDAARQSAEDYRAGRTLLVDGIMLSRTEAVLGLLARERAELRA